MYCKKCKITYDDNSNLYGDEFTEPCPVCFLKESSSQLQDKLKQVTNDLKIYQICDECRNHFGDCDIDKNVCKKLRQLLNSV